MLQEFLPNLSVKSVDYSPMLANADLFDERLLHTYNGSRSIRQRRGQPMHLHLFLLPPPKESCPGGLP